jgi:hypothetical protein
MSAPILVTALVVGAGTAANLFISAMFIARVLWPTWARPLGFVGTAMALPLTAAAVIAWAGDLDAWLVALPMVFVAFAIVEVYVDVIAATDVRSTRWLWLYLLAFYLAQWAVVGAAFIASARGGAIVLVSYFVCLVATAWSYSEVGHGRRRGSEGDDQPDVEEPTAPRTPLGPAPQ